MSKGVVVPFKLSREDRASSAPEHLRVQPRQLELFEWANASRSRFISYLPVESFDQASLIDVLERSQTKIVVDLRVKTVFRRPHYKHKELLAYFYGNKFSYIEISMLGQDGCDHPELVKRFKRVFASAYRKSQGAVACLFDFDALESGAVDDFKFELSQASTNFVVYNTRSLRRA